MSHVKEGTVPQLSGGALILAGAVLCMANFMAVLDTSIANVALPHISGGLGASATEGTMVITFYAIAEAICIPLTGWLAQRFGSVRVFLLSMTGFGISSALCGMATSLDMLLLFRVLQGLSAGPLMPLSQSLLLQITPKQQHPMALALWSMTVIVAPVCGPVLGGVLSDTVGWEWAFFINVPIAIVSIIIGRWLLSAQETPTEKLKVDFVGLVLLAVWVGALQLMLDKGREHDWFESEFIVTLGVITAIGFVSFLIWELTEKEPIVNLRLLAIPSFSLGTGVMAVAYGGFFASVVLVPLWLQNNMAYTATWAGYLTAFNGILGVIVAPFVAKLMVRFDPRAVAFVGLLGLAVVIGARALFTTDMSFVSMIPAQLAQGAFLPLMFVPMMAITLAGIAAKDLPGASGIMAFARTIAGAIGTSLVTTAWERSATGMRDELVNGMEHGSQVLAAAVGAGADTEAARQALSLVVDHQALMLATNQVFAFLGPMLAVTAILIWFTKKPSADDMAAAQSAH